MKMEPNPFWSRIYKKLAFLKETIISGFVLGLFWLSNKKKKKIWECQSKQQILWGFFDSGLGVRSDDQVEKLSIEMQL